MHKRTSRLALAAVATVAAGTLLAGCAGGGGAPTTEDGKTKVIFWQQQFEDYQQEWFKKQVQEFNAQSDDVEVQYVLEDWE